MFSPAPGPRGSQDLRSPSPIMVLGGGREKNVFRIIVENFEVFENDIFDCKVL